MEGTQSDSIVLEEEIDPNYEPTEKEVLEYATWLGMDLEAERDLFWIAREGLKAPLPENWKPCKTTDTEEIYYFNFASGQSTWDHPCDEFYRNLYEEHKKKHQSKDAQETDEKKKKEKDDVAELLGRKGNGKKKKASVTKAEPLGPAPLGRANSLEKKPLPGISGRLGALGSSGPSSVALKPVGGLGGLGPLRGEAKDLGTPGLSSDRLGDELKHDELAKPLSRPPLGGLLSRKPLLSSSPSMLPKSESKAELEGLMSDLEQKKEKMIQEHTEKLHEMESAHEMELGDLRKKMTAQLEEVRDGEEDKLKQLKREFDKKKNDLENQFDRDENTVQRSRKEQLKRLEAETENALAHKKQELERELRSETEKVRLKHEAKLCALRDEFQREEKQLADKLKASLAEQNEAVVAATELKAEVDRLENAQKSIEIELETLRNEKKVAVQEKSSAESKCDHLHLEIEDLRRQLQDVAESKAATPLLQECSKCIDLEVQVSTLQAEAKTAHERVDTERAKAQEDMNKLRAELDSLQKEVEVQLVEEKKDASKLPSDAECELANEVDVLKVHESFLKTEITALKQQLATALMESDELKTKCAVLQSTKDSSGDGVELSASALLTVPQNEIERLEHQLAAAQAEAAGTKEELINLQDQLAVSLKTNEQIKTQLMKESTEKKSLREQLDSATEEAKQGSVEQNEKYHNQLFALQQRLESESISREKQEEVCDGLRKEIHSLEHTQRKLKDDLLRLESDKRHLESENEMLSGRLDEMKTSLVHEGDSDAQSSETALSEAKWEVEQLQTSLKAMGTDKEQLEVRAKQLSKEIEELLAKVHCLETERESERNRCSKHEMENSLLKQRQQNLEEEMEGYQQKLRMQTTENGDLRGQLNKSKLKEQSAIDRAEHAADELHDLVAKVQNQQRELENAAKELRAKTGQVEEQTVQCSELRADNEALQDQISELKSSIDDMKNRQQKAAGSVRGTIGDKVSPAELGLLRDQLTEYETKLDSLMRSKTQLAEKNRALAHKNTELESSFRSLGLDKTQLEGELEMASAELSKWKASASKASKENERLTVVLRELEAEKDLLDNTLRREADQKNDLLRQKISVEQSRKVLEGEITRLNTQLQDMEAFQRSSGFESQSLQNKIKRLEGEVSELNSLVQTLQEHNNSLERSANQSTQETSRMERKIRVLKTENDEQHLKAQLTKEELARSGDMMKKMESQLADMHQRLEREGDEKRLLHEQFGELSASKDEMETLVATLKRKLDSTEAKWKDQESATSRDDLALKIRLQQSETDRESMFKSKEQAEGVLKAKEKELAVAKEEIVNIKGELESLRVRIKLLLSEKEDIQTALLSANLANASSAPGSCGSAGPKTSSTDAMLVKLQLADVNKNELEAHLADVVSQLETSKQRGATLEARCRDQAIDIETLHVEMASLRSAAQKMHLSALESLSLSERLEYDHKKRTLKNDFLSQLRSFQDREEQSLIRHKARLRAQYERQIEDLVAELEKTRQQRVEQEEACSQQVLEHIRRERDLKVREAKRRVLEELQELECDLHERKAHQMETITEAIQKEEDDLNARLRGIRQATREEDLVTLQEFPEWKVPCAQQTPSSPGEMKVLDETPRVNHRKASMGNPTPRVTNKARPVHADAQKQPAWNLKQGAIKPTQCTGRRQQQNTNTYRKWKRRLQEEINLLAKAEAMVSNQRQALLKQAQQLKSSKHDWKRASRVARNDRGSRVVQEMRRMLDENLANWSEGMKSLREQEMWVKRRQRKISQMGRTVKQMRPIRGQRFIKGSGDNNGYLSDASDNSDSAEDDEVVNISSDDSNQSEFESLLGQLEKLEEDLLSDIGESSDNLSEQINGGWYSRGYKSGHDGMFPDPKGTRSVPWPYVSQPEAMDTASRYPLSLSSEGLNGRRLRMRAGGYRAASYVDDFAGRDMASRSLHCQRMSALQRDRSANPSVASKSSRSERMKKHGSLYQRNISRWAQGREKVQHAATKHATWLSGLCEELKEYGAKYSRDKEDAAAASTSCALLDRGDEG